MWRFLFLLFLQPLFGSVWELPEGLALDGAAQSFEYSVVQPLRDPSTGERYLVKQITLTNSSERLLGLVAEVLASELAEIAEIATNRVRFIPADALTTLKPFPERPATLHSWAPGAPYAQFETWADLEVSQRLRPPESPHFRKYGPLSPEKRGLTALTVAHMARHRDLPEIVALDTLLGNRDRFSPNLFYDPDTDRFTGIDLGESFKLNLAQEALIQVPNIVQAPLSPVERKAFEAYLDALKVLLALPETDSLSQRFEQLVRFLADETWDEGMETKLRERMECIRSSISDATLLAALS